MDKRPIIGIFLIFLILIGWQFFIMKKMPPKNQIKQNKIQVQNVQKENSAQPKQDTTTVHPVSKNRPYIREISITAAKSGAISKKETAVEKAVQVSARFDTLENKLYRIIFSSVGGSIVSVQLKKFEGLPDTSGNKKRYLGKDRVELIPSGGNALQDEVVINNQKFYLGDNVFKVAEKTDKKIVYDFTIPGKDSTNSVEAQKIYEFSDSSYIFDLTYNLPGAQEHNIIINSGLASTESNKQLELRYFSGVASLGKTVYVKTLQQLDTVPKGDQGNIDWVGVKNKYFLTAIIPLCETKSYEMKKFAFGNTGGGGGCACNFVPVTVNPDAIRIGLDLTTRADSSYKYKIFAGPVDYEILSRTGYGLQEACYLGMKWIRPVSRLFINVFIGLHKVIPNYGVVIIIFSFLIAMIFFPLTKISQKSAISMQRMQPKLQELQKRYKSDPKKLNQATMELYRKEGISPVSGCLPLVIQMPVFFALYAVLDSSIALRNAIFIPGWIENLSQPDPFFALPIAMGVMMFFQQKLQGSASAGMSSQMAQQQKMMMYFMPIMFVVIFLRFPAGLVLYWFVYNIFSVAQTYLIKRSLSVQELKS